MVNEPPEGLKVRRLLSEGEHALLWELQNEASCMRVAKTRAKPSCLVWKSVLDVEAKAYYALKGVGGFPEAELRHLIDEDCLILAKLGPSLEALRLACSGRFTARTVLLLLLQIVDLCAELHSRGLVHGNIRPNHLLMGLGKKRDTLHLIDLTGTCRPSASPALTSPAKGQGGAFGAIGTPGQPFGFGDELESVCYVCIFLLKGRLPWSNETDERLIHQAKTLYPVEKLCAEAPRLLRRRTS